MAKLADSIVVAERVLILGRDAAGKSPLARRLGVLTGVPAIELDQLFWHPSLIPTPPDRWVAIQEGLIEPDRWIIGGHLGPYDVLEARLKGADTVIILDFSLLCCAWRSIRRSREASTTGAG
jgi:adenylate kinase family enzyme